MTPLSLTYRWLIALAVVLVVSGLGKYLDDRDYFYDDLRISANTKEKQ
ncbi:hypothetical protein QTI05_22565 [Variovorax sp. J22R193]|nr:hypothetical protein [Variovorax sp. J22R193]MDM0041841.1 hypothetical protein [Variovorax sp. J22R193]